MSRLKSLLLQTKSLLRGRYRISSRTFLIVDDDTAGRQVLGEYLRSFGYKKIIEASDGAEAIEILKGAEIDFVIADWEMPNASGLDLLKFLKSEERYRHIPFIMATSPVSQERSKVESAASLNVDGYIVKPFRSKTLQEKIHEALASSNIRGRKAVVLIDDDDEVRATVKEYIEHLGLGPVHEARDGEEGFTLIRQRVAEVGLVLSDWEMPRLAGIDLLRRVRKDPELAHMPFIMITSQTSIERLKIEQALDLNVDHYLLKPFKVSDLREKIDIVLRKARGNLALERNLTRGEECLLLLRWDDAILAFRQVLDAEPRNVRAHVGLGIAHRGLGDEKSVFKGVQYFRKAIAINPASEDAHLELALTYEHARAADQAIASLQQAITLCIFSEKIQYHLGRLLLMKGSDEQGLAHLKKALELKPDFEEAQLLLQGRDDEDGGESES